MVVYAYHFSFLLRLNKWLNNLHFMIPHLWASRSISLYTVLNYLRWSHAGERRWLNFLCTRVEEIMNKSNGWVTLIRKHPIAEYISSLYGFVFLGSGVIYRIMRARKFFSLRLIETRKRKYNIGYLCDLKAIYLIIIPW